VVVVLGGYFAIVGNDRSDEVMPADQGTGSAMQPAIEDSGHPAETELDALGDAAKGAVASLGEAATEAGKAIDSAGSDIATAMQTGADTASVAVTDALHGAAGSARTALDGIDPSLLTVDGFDYDQIVAKIEASSLSDGQKTALIKALDTARKTPATLSAALSQLRADLQN